jgi:lysozyme family protein
MSSSTLRMLQADLNLYAPVANFEPVKVDGAVGPQTLNALEKVVAAVLAKNSLMTPAAFTTNGPEDLTKYTEQIRDWLHDVASKALEVTPLRLYKKGAGKDWNEKGAIVYGAGATHDEFVGLQRDLNRLATTVGFGTLDEDGFIGPKTASAIKATYDKVVAKNAMLGVTLFPVPDTKEETAEYAAFIRDWLDKVASKHLTTAEAGA